MNGGGVVKLPFDFLSQNYVKPNLYLCETDKQRICQLETISLSGSFKFNAYSELNFSVGRTYTNMVTGETLVNPFYHKIEALRLVELEGFGYFEIQDPEITSDGIKEIKEVTAYSLEYRLSQKYLEGIKINTGDANSMEVIASGGGVNVIPISLLNNNKELSLLDIALEKIYDWEIGYIDESLKTMTRQFDISRASVYDFIVQDICEKFNCYAIFDTINNKINIYAEALITKHIGDGASNIFIVTSAYDEVDTVTIDSYKTTQYHYYVETNEITEQKIGYIVFDTPPKNGARIEITDGSQTKWQTDVYVTFDNLAQEVNVSYSAEDIKTVLTVKGADDLGIHEVNMGLPYIVDLSYYYTVDWMGQDLYDAYTKYLQNNNNAQAEYIENSTKMREISGRIDYETYRLSLKYSVAENVTSTTVGTYYVKCDTENAGLYYKEVKLPDEYKAGVKYWMINGTDLNTTKTDKLCDAIVEYFKSEEEKDTSHIKVLNDDFSFVESYTINHLMTDLNKATATQQKDTVIKRFLKEIFYQFGKTELHNTYYLSYKQRMDAVQNKESWNYHALTLFMSIIEDEIEERNNIINSCQEQYNLLDKSNAEIANNILMDVFFVKYYKNQGFNDNEARKRANRLLVRLSPFLREDEYTDDNFIETDSDTTETLMKTKQELLECGKIELAKLCEPKLAFSMDMANIYALKEFEPIIHQFQLGNFINVAIREDYVKKARLLAVDINFDDFSDFSCEFGELTNLRTPSSIHADLLANALTAGSSVASGQSYWDKGADLATSTDLKIQNGLLNAINGIYNTDKSVLIDNSGILLRQVLDNGEYSPYQIWLTNNNILVSTDSFQTAQAGLGVFEVDGRELYGVLAKAVLSGYVESSHIVGGTIRIGEQADGTYAFEVHEDGSVTMSGGIHSIDGYATTVEMNNIQSQIDSINDAKMYRVEIATEDPTIITTSADTATMYCKVYSWDVEITDSIDASLFAWKRVSANEEQDVIWNAIQEHQGVKSITISADDIIENSSFTCDVNLPE